MIKRIIFDLDNTLIMWQEKYKMAIKNTIDYYKLDVDYHAVDQVIESYNNYYDIYQKENMLQLINREFNLNLRLDFIDKWLDELGSMAEIDEDVIDTLEYLSQKYELVVLTNWFKESQVSRLKKAEIYHFFKEIYDGEEVAKPNPLSFKKAIGNNEKEECLMIGDDIETDIKGAINFGIKAILIDPNDKYKDSEYIRINNLKQLKEML